MTSSCFTFSHLKQSLVYKDGSFFLIKDNVDRKTISVLFMHSKVCLIVTTEEGVRHEIDMDLPTLDDFIEWRSCL